ncbi:MAG: nucleotidyl transferase AbiEii/AbiGii toxin family protein [Oligoflexia bacterium]|nr:nucleotidyl transferase AbiEii/AbiGii toxin family protein [Oligoflexia bacterium]
MYKFYHQDKNAFIDALNATSARSGFSSRLLEKDYFCSLILRELYSKNNSNNQIVFKGGTLLNKVYAGFYRLSEDLDFTISTPADSTRKERSDKIRPFKEIFKNIAKEVLNLSVTQELKGSNQSVQYIGKLEYESATGNGDIKENILFEIGMREEIIIPHNKGKARTLLIDPWTKSAVIPDFEVICLAVEEAYAEKIRAALTREKVAIRDIYDIDYAVKKGIINLKSPILIKLVKSKLAITGDNKINITNSRKDDFKKQLNTQLLPVLKSGDYASFDFENAWNYILELGKDYS